MQAVRGRLRLPRIIGQLIPAAVNSVEICLVCINTGYFGLPLAAIDRYLGR